MTPTYKNRTLVRSGDTIFLGSVNDPFIVQIDIKTKIKTENGDEIAEKVDVQLIATDPNLPLDQRFEKSREKNGLYEALDIADAWLSRKESEAKK